MLQEKLNLKFNYRTTYAESLRNRDRLRVYERISNQPIGYEYIETVEAIVDTEAKLNEICAKETVWPKCLKLNSDSQEVYIVNNSQELQQNVLRLKLELYQRLHKSELFLTRFYAGTKHRLNLIMSDGLCLLYDMTNEDDFDKQEAMQIRNCVVNKLRFLGMTHGIFNCDMIYTLFGMKIVNILPLAKESNAVRERTGVDLLKAELILNLPLRYECPHV